MINDQITRAGALAWVIALWAAIYLPALGSLEIKGEEGRRILPAVTMLETGNWIVPSVGGVDYFSKPPLINWMVAAGFKLSGTRSEWAARLPTALCVLALGSAIVWTLSAWLSPGGALIAAVFALTNIGLMEKGRLTEIEGSYISLFGLALVTWLGAWRGEASPWRTWTLPWAFLGLALLEKGPAALAFFYVFVVAVLWSAGRGREFWNWAHLAGVALMLGIFAAWAIPHLRESDAGRVGSVWRAQFEGRMEINEGFHFKGWILNIPRGLDNYLPWTVLLPLLWRRGVGMGWLPQDAAILRGGRLAVAGCFLAVSLAPGGLPRYTLPLLVPASLLLALTMQREWTTGNLPKWLPLVWARSVLTILILALLGAVAAAFVAGGRYGWIVAAGVALGFGGGWWINRRRGESATAAPVVLPLAKLYPAAVLALGSAVAMGALTFDYALGTVPRLRRAENVRPLAERINRETAHAPGQPVYVLSPGFLPFLFYLRDDPRYVQKTEEIPSGAGYLLAREKEVDSAAAQLAARGVHAQRVLSVKDKNRGQWVLLSWEGGKSLSL